MTLTKEVENFGHFVYLHLYISICKYNHSKHFFQNFSNMKKRHFKKYIAPYASSDKKFRRDPNFRIFYYGIVYVGKSGEENFESMAGACKKTFLGTYFNERIANFAYIITSFCFPAFLK